ncbi:CDF family Co(II)/Ni(II) efflux transporter DmeF [Agarivorans sp. QJM3NY_33]|uniref:CDF family Co(II)/Ni(II) efflux transporter DmeF n=1 Tax=Agarivorans sp. QJM3NY_33 TaxID=3421432 RepID=UPI003D7CD424
MLHQSDPATQRRCRAFVSHSPQGESRTRYVLALTVVTMLLEITAGSLFGSMALLADGWHMGTHAAAFMITLFAYRYARTHANNPDFSFGTGKVSVLGGYSSAIALGMVALLMAVESIERLFNPLSIQFNEAIGVALLGLLVNLASMLLLQEGHHHGHDHDHDRQGSHPQDHNLKAAYMHVLADALTSVLAIAALFIGKYLGWTWLDPVIGVVGALVISKWSWGLIKQTSPILLDANIAQVYQQKVLACLELGGDKVSDIHIWRVSADHYCAAISIISPSPRPLSEYKQRLAQFDKIHHLTIEVSHGA